MPESVQYRFVGPTFAVTNVINTSSGVNPTTVTAAPNEPFNYGAFLNVGPSPVLVSLGPLNGNPPAAIFPTTTSGPVQGFVVPPNMTVPMLVATPPGFKMAVVSNSSVATQIYVTPAGTV